MTDKTKLILVVFAHLLVFIVGISVALYTFLLNGNPWYARAYVVFLVGGFIVFGECVLRTWENKLRKELGFSAYENTFLGHYFEPVMGVPITKIMGQSIVAIFLGALFFGSFL